VTDDEVTMIRQFLSWNYPPAEPQSASELALTYLAQTLAEIDRLRMELSKCSESFDKLSMQYHEARERWKQMMDRERAQNAAMRPIVEEVAWSDSLLYESHTGAWFCAACGAWQRDAGAGVEAEPVRGRHYPTCLVTEARALLAKEGDA
jgi:hypothetical protein